LNLFQKLLIRFAISSVVLALISVIVPHASGATLELNPKIGGCYLFTEKELNAASPLTNPISCSKVHNAETYWVGKWNLRNQPWKYTNEMVHDAAAAICEPQWPYAEDSDLNYWAFYTPSPAQWAKGARWVRCDAMSVISKSGSFNQRYGRWTGNAGLNDGYLA
jgi:hypothetical protein